MAGEHTKLQTVSEGLVRSETSTGTHHVAGGTATAARLWFNIFGALSGTLSGEQ